MSNPRYSVDLPLLEDHNYNLDVVVGAETILIVTGCWIGSELLDRPVAEFLRDTIDEKGVRISHRRGIVMSDHGWLIEERLWNQPLISIGSPEINSVTAKLTKDGNIIEAGTTFQAIDSKGLSRIALWGHAASETRESVHSFVDSGLEEFLRHCWRTQ